MISASDRENAVLLIDEAIKSGHPVKRHVNVSESQNGLLPLEKRKADTDSYEDGRPHADHSNPANKSKRLIFRYDRKIPDYFSVVGAPLTIHI